MNSKLSEALTGRVLSEEHKRNISKSLLESTRVRRGKDSHLWKGGVTSLHNQIRKSAEYRAWRRMVYERDNYTCVECGKRSKRGKRITLNADHIKPFSLYPELRFEVANGRTLCVLCHKRTETYGWNYFNITTAYRRENFIPKPRIDSSGRVRDQFGRWYKA